MNNSWGRAMDNEEMEINPRLYELICKKRFDDAAGERAEIIRLLRGVNGKPGLVDDVRDLKKVYRTLVAVLVFVLTTLFVQFAAWARNRFFMG